MEGGGHGCPAAGFLFFVHPMKVFGSANEYVPMPRLVVESSWKPWRTNENWSLLHLPFHLSLFLSFSELTSIWKSNGCKMLQWSGGLAACITTESKSTQVRMFWTSTCCFQCLTAFETFCKSSCEYAKPQTDWGDPKLSNAHLFCYSALSCVLGLFPIGLRI